MPSVITCKTASSNKHSEDLKRNFRRIVSIAIFSLLPSMNVIANTSTEMETKSIKVRDAGYDRYMGEIMILPTSKNWQKAEIEKFGVSLEVPGPLERVPLERYPVKIYRSVIDPRALVVGLYPVFNKLGALPSVEVELKRYSLDELKKHINEEQDLCSKVSISSSTDSDFEYWREIEEHRTLSVKDPVSWQTWYRKDLHFENGDVLTITGHINKYFEKKNDQSLFPEMDLDIRRVIESIAPREDAIPAKKSLLPTSPVEPGGSK